MLIKRTVKEQQDDYKKAVEAIPTPEPLLKYHEVMDVLEDTLPFDQLMVMRERLRDMTYEQKPTVNTIIQKFPVWPQTEKECPPIWKSPFIVT